MDNELDKFLSQIDEIDTLINAMKTENADEREEAFKNVDIMLNELENRKSTSENLSKKGVDRTVISKSPQLDNTQESFLKDIEADALRRSIDRQRRKKLSDQLKEAGNNSFKQGNYEDAAQYYTKALADMKDNLPVWTNRAQTYIKIGMYEQAIEDCDFAFRIEEFCLKALIHKAKALMFLKRFEEAESVLEVALDHHPNEGKIIGKYLDELQEAKTAFEEELLVEREKTSGNVEIENIAAIIERLSKPNQNIIFYTGGLAVLCELLKDNIHAATFRCNGGFSFFNENKHILECLHTDIDASDEKCKFISIVLKVITNVCTKSPSSQSIFFTVCKKLIDGLLKFLYKVYVEEVRVQTAVLFNTIACEKSGRRLICENISLSDLLVGISCLINETQRLAELSIELLSMLTFENKFVYEFKFNCDEVLLPILERVLIHPVSDHQLKFCIMAGINLCQCQVILYSMCSRKEFWIACLVALKRYSNKSDECALLDVYYPLLGLVDNILKSNSSESGSQPLNEQVGLEIYFAVIPLLGRADPVRVCRVISHLLPQCAPACKSFAQSSNLISLLFQYLKSQNDERIKYALRTLCIIIDNHENVRNLFLSQNDAFKSINVWLKSDNNSICASAALLLSHLLEDQTTSEKFSKALVKQLLSLASNHNCDTVRANCAITLARLCRTNDKFIDLVRSLGGWKILESCVTLVT